MENFVFPDNLLGILIFNQIAHYGNIFKYSAMQNVHTLNSSKEKLSGFIKLKVA